MTAEFLTEQIGLWAEEIRRTLPPEPAHVTRRRVIELARALDEADYRTWERGATDGC